MTPKRTAVVTKYWLYSGFKTRIKFRLQLVQKQRPIRNSVGFILAVFAIVQLATSDFVIEITP